VFFFFPPTAVSSFSNVVFLALLGGIYVSSATLYRVHSLAQTGELGEKENDRFAISAAEGLFTLLGAGIVLFCGPLLLEATQGTGAVGSHQSSVLIASFCGLVFFAAGLLALPWKSFANAGAGKARPGASFRTALTDKTFLIFLLASASLWFVFYTLASCALAISLDLMLVDEEFARLSVLLVIGAALPCLAVVWFSVKKLGTKRVMLAGLASFALLSGLLVFTGILPNTAGLRWNCVTSIAETKDGTLYFGTWRGVSRLVGNEWKGITKEDGLIDDRVTSIAATDDGVWFGTLGGASFFDGKKWTSYSKASGLIDNQVLTIIPRGKATWFQTPKGVSRFDGTSWQEYAPEPEQKEKPIAPLTAFCLGQRGDLWTGTEEGAFRYSETGWTHVTSSNGLKDDLVTSMAVAPGGDVLLGTYKGVARFNGKTWNYYTKDDGLPSNAVRLIKVSPDGRLYIATSKGVAIYDGKTMRTLTVTDGLAYNKVTDIFFSKDGAIWFATGNGVSEFRNGVWTNHQYPFPWMWGLVLCLLLGFPLAILVSLPNLFVAQRAAEEARGRGGVKREATFFAIHGLFQRFALLIAGAFLAFFFTVFGADIANPTGIRAALLFAALAALFGFIVMLRYPEKTGALSAARK
jgi:Na+/melibiose symporter-like transporter